MDPVSAVGLAGSAASLAVLTARIAKDIHNILDKYQNVAKILQAIEKECVMLRIGFKHIETWLNNNEHRSAEMQERILDLSTCLPFFEESLRAVDAEISKHGQLATDVKFGTKNKIKFLWNEDIVKSHLDEVRFKRDALGFIILTFQLSATDSKRQIRQVARASSIRLSRHRDGQSVMSRDSGDFEAAIANSSAYRRATYAPPRSMRMIRDSQDDWDENLSQLSTGTTLVAMSDYAVGEKGHLQILDGDFVKILEKRLGPLWYGEINGRKGQFPIGCCDTSEPLIGSFDTSADPDTMKSTSGLAAPTIVNSNPWWYALESNLTGRAQVEPDTSADRAGSKPVAVAATNSTPSTSSRPSAGTPSALPDQGFSNAKSQRARGYLPPHNARLEALKDNRIPDLLKEGKTSYLLGSENDSTNRHDVEKFFPGANQSRKNVTAAQELSGWTDLHCAVLNNDGKLVRKLVKEGSNIHLETSEGLTALHIASSDPLRENCKIVKVLLDYGASVRQKSPSGRSLLHEQVQLNRFSTARLLLQKGAPVGARDSSRQTPLHLAASLGRVDFVKELVKLGADTRASDNKGRSPLLVGASQGHADIIQVLIDYVPHMPDSRSLLLAKDKLGRTALHLASEHGKTEVVQKINSEYSPEFQIFLNLKDNKGLTALHYSAEAGHDETGEALIVAGASFTVYDLAGWTPLHFASANGHDDFAHMLLDKNGYSLLRQRPLGFVEKLPQRIAGFAASKARPWLPLSATGAVTFIVFAPTMIILHIIAPAISRTAFSYNILMLADAICCSCGIVSYYQKDKEWASEKGKEFLIQNLLHDDDRPLNNLGLGTLSWTIPLLLCFHYFGRQFSARLLLCTSWAMESGVSSYPSHMQK